MLTSFCCFCVKPLSVSSLEAFALPTNLWALIKGLASLSVSCKRRPGESQLEMGTLDLVTYDNLSNALSEGAEHHTSGDGGNPRLILSVVCMFEVLYDLHERRLSTMKRKMSTSTRTRSFIVLNFGCRSAADVVSPSRSSTFFSNFLNSGLLLRLSFAALVTPFRESSAIARNFFWNMDVVYSIWERLHFQQSSYVILSKLTNLDKASVMCQSIIAG